MPNFQTTVASKFESGSVDDIVENEQEYGNDDRHTQSAFADDCPERCADEEEYQASKRERKLLLQLNLVANDGALVVGGGIALKLEVGLHLSCALNGIRHVALAVAYCFSGKERVDVTTCRHCGKRHLGELATSIFVDGRIGADSGIIVVEQHCAVRVADAIEANVDRVDCMPKFFDVFTDILASHVTLVHSVEVGIEGNHDFFVGKRFAPIRHTAASELLVAEVFELLTGPKCQRKMLFVVSEFHLPGIGKDDTRVGESARHIINHHIVKHTGLTVFLFDKYVISLNLVVEHTLGDFQFGRLLSHRE